jgi:acyl phosphate:glycerol-3-phosphate acyltransferase
MEHWIWFALLGYICGSIPFGLLLTKAAGLGDVRKIGSGNIGATNVLRTGNKKIAALTLFLDGLKAFVPVFVGVHFVGLTVALAAAGGALAGHCFPVWLGFKGGKGVASFVGLLFGLDWILGLVFVVMWLGCAVMFRMSSLAALLASAATPVFAWLLGRHDLVIPVAVLALVIWIMHRENILRLLQNREAKISFGKK